MAAKKSSKRKSPKRVAAGKKAWATRLRRHGKKKVLAQMSRAGKKGGKKSAKKGSKKSSRKSPKRSTKRRATKRAR